MLRTERDLLQKRLNRILRKLFDAKCEADYARLLELLAVQLHNYPPFPVRPGV